MAHPEMLINAFARLGDSLRQAAAGLNAGPGVADGGTEDLAPWEELLSKTHEQNAWYTREQVLYAMRQWGELLREADLAEWLSAYPRPGQRSLTIALVLAGNIPLVGFHDFLCVLITGNRALVRCPSNDRLLLPFLASRLQQTEPALAESIRFTDGKLEGFDAVIATGSNNTSRYFDHYFASWPNIIRKNRNSVAILTGRESEAELQGLAEDVFRYFGMGCRSVSKLFVPSGFDFDRLFKAFFAFRHLTDHQKYANNYDYNKAVYLMSGAHMLDNGFLLLKEDSGMGSPIGTLFYETYESLPALRLLLEGQAEALQCVVGPAEIKGAIPYGTSQQPGLADYADGVDTVDFLLRNAGN